MLCRVISFKLQ